MKRMPDQMPNRARPNLRRSPSIGATVILPPDSSAALREGDRVDPNEAWYVAPDDSPQTIHFQTDEIGRWTYLTESWTDLTGWSVAETLGKQFIQFVHPEERAGTMELFRAVTEGGLAACDHETRYRMKDGGWRWIRLHARLLIDETGAMVGNVGSIVDIDRQKEFEAHLLVAEERRKEVLARIVHVEEEERSRIAGELHDDTIQIVVAALFTLDSQMHMLHDGDAARALELAVRLRSTLADAVERARRLTFQLQSPLLERHGVMASLADLGATMAGDAGLEVVVRGQIGRCDASTELVIYRSVQELMQNARRHAEASRLEVEIAEHGDAIEVAVRDDGRGFDPKLMIQRKGGVRWHFGLEMITERIRLAGGEFSLSSAPGKGTAVHFTVPKIGVPESV
jgi:PAS domain S-box-containing protein